MTFSAAEFAAALDMVYLARLPASIPPGKVLVHNSVRATRRLGSRGFRAWLADPDPANQIVCACDPAPELGPHYIVGVVEAGP